MKTQFLTMNLKSTLDKLQAVLMFCFVEKSKLMCGRFIFVIPPKLFFVTRSLFLLCPSVKAFCVNEK